MNVIDSPPSADISPEKECLHLGLVSGIRPTRNVCWISGSMSVEEMSIVHIESIIAHFSIPIRWNKPE